MSTLSYFNIPHMFLFLVSVLYFTILFNFIRNWCEYSTNKYIKNIELFLFSFTLLSMYIFIIIILSFINLPFDYFIMINTDSITISESTVNIREIFHLYSESSNNGNKDTINNIASSSNATKDSNVNIIVPIESLKVVGEIAGTLGVGAAVAAGLNAGAIAGSTPTMKILASAGLGALGGGLVLASTMLKKSTDINVVVTNESNTQSNSKRTSNSEETFTSNAGSTSSSDTMKADSSPDSFITSPIEVSDYLSLFTTDNFVLGFLLIIQFIMILNLIFSILLLICFITKELSSVNFSFNFVDNIFPTSKGSTIIKLNTNIKWVLKVLLSYLARTSSLNIFIFILLVIISNLGLLYYFTQFVDNFEHFARVFLQQLKK